MMRWRALIVAIGGTAARTQVLDNTCIDPVKLKWWGNGKRSSCKSDWRTKFTAVQPRPTTGLTVMSPSLVSTIQVGTRMSS